MKRYKRRKLRKLAFEILKGLARGGFILAIFALPNLGQIMKIFKAIDKHERFKIKRAIKTLQTKGLVSVVPSKDPFEAEIRLTRAGNELAEFERLYLPKPKRWDGKWRIIAFDVPEKYKQARRSLHMKLRELGCYRYQNSVFVYPYECKKEIELIQNYFGFGDYIRYIVAEKLDNNTTLEDFFKL